MDPEIVGAPDVCVPGRVTDSIVPAALEEPALTIDPPLPMTVPVVTTVAVAETGIAVDAVTGVATAAAVAADDVEDDVTPEGFDDFEKKDSVILLKVSKLLDALPVVSPEAASAVPSPPAAAAVGSLVLVVVDSIG